MGNDVQISWEPPQNAGSQVKEYAVFLAMKSQQQQANNNNQQTVITIKTTTIMTITLAPQENVLIVLLFYKRGFYASEIFLCKLRS